MILVGMICLVIMFLPTCAPAPEPEPEPAPEPQFDPEAERAAVRNVEKKLVDAWNAHDAKAIVAEYTEETEGWEGAVKGRAAIEQYLTKAFEGPFKNVQTKLIDEIGIVFVTPEVAIFKGRYENSEMLDEEGNALPDAKLLYAQVYVKKNGRWLAAHGFFTRPIVE
jgi:uncharacterized protein (TIGR02246 family)